MSWMFATINSCWKTLLDIENFYLIFPKISILLPSAAVRVVITLCNFEEAIPILSKIVFDNKLTSDPVSTRNLNAVFWHLAVANKQFCCMVLILIEGLLFNCTLSKSWAEPSALRSALSSFPLELCSLVHQIHVFWELLSL